jgi:hypothetical protein
MDVFSYLTNEAKMIFSSTPLKQFLEQGVANERVYTIFGDMGKRIGLYVSSKPIYKDRTEAEFLYDMSWYKDEGGFLIRQAAVFEFEWQHDVHVDKMDNLNSDFQKLVQARSETRVWASTVPDSESLRRHVDNCKLQISKFLGSESGDKYVFIINNWGTGKAFIEEHVFATRSTPMDRG